jgi:saccharopine dehydrogenase-like NADP-dependent oxidoreductase
MAVVVLGGAGHIGSGVVRELVRLSPGLEVVIADRNVERGRELAGELGDRVSVRGVEAEDPSSLVEALKGAEVAVSTLGPFYRHGERVLRAALRAGVNLVDIDDDYDATERCLGLDREAREAGVLAIVGLGATPGLTNLMARLGAEGMEAEEVDTAWAWTAVDPSMGPAIVHHFFHAITGEVPTYREGEWVRVKALSEPEVVEFPPPLGRMEVGHVGHPEPVTLPRYLRGVRRVTNKGTIWPRLLAEVAGTFARMGLTELREVNVRGQSLSPREFLVELTLRLEELAPPELMEEAARELEAFGEYAMGVGLRVEVRGKREGKEVRRFYSLASPSAVRATALPAALGALWVLRGEVGGKGVHAPEGVIEPSRFLREVAGELEIWEGEERRGRLGGG